MVSLPFSTAPTGTPSAWSRYMAWQWSNSPCPTREDFLQSFMVFVIRDISSISAWNSLGAATNPVSSKRFDKSEIRQSIEPFS